MHTKQTIFLRLRCLRFAMKYSFLVYLIITILFFLSKEVAKLVFNLSNTKLLC